MGPSEDVQSEAGAIIAKPRDSTSPPLASESTEADENNPDSHTWNSPLSSPASFRMKTSALHTPKNNHAVGGSPGARELSSDGAPLKSSCVGGERSDKRSTQEGSSSTLLQQWAVGASSDETRECDRYRADDAPHSSPSSSESSSLGASKASQAVVCDFDCESDEDIAVYIDDDDDTDAVPITEHKISAEKAAEIKEFKAKWVLQMLTYDEGILGLKSGKVVKKRGRPAKHAVESAPKLAWVTEFLQGKLEAFAKCMTTEALDCIQRSGRGWWESAAFSDSAESDDTSSGSPSLTARAPRKNPTSASAPSVIRGVRLPTRSLPSNFFPKGQRQSDSLHVLPDGKPSDSAAATEAAALGAWRSFLKYVRRYCKPVPLQPRIERAAGLESDDDDEQAPLYMCRPGCVQRPSPLISHSLTEHLKASHTLFFKRFEKRTPATHAAFQEGSSARPVAEEQEGHIPSGATPASTPMVSQGRKESVLSAASDDGSHAAANAASEAAPQDAVPLYQVTAEASAAFGDLMRLEDTVRMLEASCTFRLAAAPYCRIRKKKGQRKRPDTMRNLSESTATPSRGSLCSPASETPTVALVSPRHKGRRHVSACTTPAPVVSSQGVEGKPEAAGSHRASSQVVTCAATGRGPGPQEAKPPARAEEQKARTVYAVHADEDTLALSGLDSDYCSRVLFASQGAHRARESLAYLKQGNASGQTRGSTQQEASAVSGVAQKKRRKTPDDEEFSSGEEDLDSDSIVLEEPGPGAAAREDSADASQDTALIADKLLLAHLMPYLPHFGPE